MIDQLRISGVGVIDQALLDLSPGFTVITGETGAGKTMILTALRLLVGEKADTALVRKGHKQIEVDGTFQLQQGLTEALADLGLDADEEMIVSRTVPKEGRSRAVLQGRPAPLTTLRELVGPLVTIHGQADQWRVRRADVQRDLLDSYGGAELAETLEQYSEHWSRAVQLKKTLDHLHEDHDQRQIEIRYLSEIVSSVEELALAPNEEDELQQQIDRLSHTAELSQEVTFAFEALRGTELRGGVEDGLSRATGSLRQAALIDSQLERLAERLDQAEADIADAASELRDYLETLEEDPAELARLQQRRADLENLMKGRATSAAELLEWLASAKSRLEELVALSGDPTRIAEELADTQQDVLRIGKNLHGLRARAAKELSAAVTEEIRALAMSGADFRVSVEQGTPTASGLDAISMDLRGRPGGPFRPLGDGASGGELSRLMLALEVVLGQTRPPGTYVFDEVDQGIGGHTATEVGGRLKRLGSGQQVIAVTHLPQVAALADLHLVLQREGAETSVQAVSGQRRVEEIMRMLGADPKSTSARRHAEELLGGKSWQD